MVLAELPIGAACRIADHYKGEMGSEIYLKSSDETLQGCYKLTQLNHSSGEQVEKWVSQSRTCEYA